MDALDLARNAIAGIGPGWNAASVERDVIDFKETPDTALAPDAKARQNIGRERKAFLARLAEAAACLANADGGVIVLGVRDRAVTREDALQGVDAATYRLDDVRLAIHHGTSPPLTVELHEHDENGCRLVLIRVPRGAVLHSTSGGVYKRRVGDQCLPIGPGELRGLQALRGQYDWSAESSGLGPERVSVVALARAAERLRAAGADDLAALAEDDRDGFLATCDLLVDGKLRRAGVLLYGDASALHAVVPDWGVILTTAPSPGSEGAILMRREDAVLRPLVLLVDDVLARLSALASVETLRAGAAQVELVDYPGDVVRELLANAFAHRDWEIPGAIEISHSPDELSFSSPGGLLPTLRPDRLLRETAQRNRVLAREVARLRIAEGAGLGFDRVWRLLTQLGKEPPRIHDGPAFVVTVEGGRGDASFARFLYGDSFPERRLASDLDVLLVLSALRRRRTIDAVKLAGPLQRDDLFVQRVLVRMAAAGLVESTRATARKQFPSYRLTAGTRATLRGALAYRIDSIDSDDAKLVRHLKRHGRISNQDVRDYLDCDVPTARNRLARLRQKGWIDFAPESARRGPSVSYVALDALDEVE